MTPEDGEARGHVRSGFQPTVSYWRTVDQAHGLIFGLQSLIELPAGRRMVQAP